MDVPGDHRYFEPNKGTDTETSYGTDGDLHQCSERQTNPRMNGLHPLH